MVKVASRHTERLTLLPTPFCPDAGPPVDDADGIASLLVGAATVADRLAATPELRLEIRTPGATRYVTLVDPDGDHDMRAAFGDICSRLRLLDIDLVAGSCTDQYLLEALSEAEKVAIDERFERIE